MNNKRYFPKHKQRYLLICAKWLLFIGGLTCFITLKCQASFSAYTQDKAIYYDWEIDGSSGVLKIIGPDTVQELKVQQKGNFKFTKGNLYQIK